MNSCIAAHGIRALCEYRSPYEKIEMHQYRQAIHRTRERLPNLTPTNSAEADEFC